MVLQGPLRGMRWLAHASTHGCWLGSYEYEKQRLFSRTLQPGMVVYDIGANVGLYTLLAARRVGPAGRVFSFEPGPQNVSFLKRHLVMNRLANVTVIEAAVGERSGTGAFDAGPNQSEGRLTADGNLHVTIVALDEMIQAGALLDADLMKIDVEGAENLVLHGAKALLVKCHPMIFLATHTSESHYACCKFLNDLGYRLATIDGSALDATDELVATFNS